MNECAGSPAADCNRDKYCFHVDWSSSGFNNASDPVPCVEKEKCARKVGVLALIIGLLSVKNVNIVLPFMFNILFGCAKKRLISETGLLRTHNMFWLVEK